MKVPSRRVLFDAVCGRWKFYPPPPQFLLFSFTNLTKLKLNLTQVCRWDAARLHRGWLLSAIGTNGPLYCNYTAYCVHSTYLLIMSVRYNLLNLCKICLILVNLFISCICSDLRTCMIPRPVWIE